MRSCQLALVVACSFGPAGSLGGCEAEQPDSAQLTTAPDVVSANDTTGSANDTSSGPATALAIETASAAETAAAVETTLATARQLGTVTAAGGCDLPSLFVGARCEQYIVRCEGLADATVKLLIAEPTNAGPPRATALLGSGSAGASPIEKAATDPHDGNPFVAEFEKLRAQGFRLIERAWQGDTQGDRGWLRGADGADDAACRYATLSHWLSDRYAAEDAATCALGFSGGSMELAMAMANWGTADHLDLAVFESGPIARFDDGCNGGAAWTERCDAIADAQPWECIQTPLACVLGDDITLLLDASYEGEPVCSSRAAANQPTLYRDSVLGPNSVHDFPGTRLTTVLGMRDCGSGAATGGADFAGRVTGLGGAHANIVTVPGAGHTVHATALGAQRLREAFEAGCGAL